MNIIPFIHAAVRSFTLVLALTVSACTSNLFEEEPAAGPAAIFDHLWTSFDQHYAPFQERGVDWNELYNTYRPQVSANTTEEALYEILTEMLSHLDDGHVQLSSPDRKVFYSNRYYRERTDEELFDLELIKTSYLKGQFREGKEDSYVYGLLPDNIIYLHLPFVAGNWAVLNRALDEYPGAAGLVIDLRHNEGGDFTWAFSEMGRLVDEHRLVFRSRTKNGPGREDYTEWHDWHIEPRGKRFAGRIAVLTDRYTISAGERAAMAFAVLPQATLVGDTTNGAHSTMIGRELANGWAYSLATQQVLFADGRSYEGIGIMPDVMVRNTAEGIRQGKDEVLERGMEVVVR